MCDEERGRKLRIHLTLPFRVDECATMTEHLGMVMLTHSVHKTGQDKARQGKASEQSVTYLVDIEARTGIVHYIIQIYLVMPSPLPLCTLYALNNFLKIKCD